VITQNIDGLHQMAGSRNVIEVHGNHYQLECIRCDRRMPVLEEHYEGGGIPRCPECGFQLKPSVVLFGEAIRGIDRIGRALDGCDVLLVVGTSAQVQPVASFPWSVKARGGAVLELNLEETPLTGACSDYLIKGRAGVSLPALLAAVQDVRSGHSGSD